MTLPESSILGCSSPRDDFGDKDWWVFSNVGVICASSNTEAQSWVTLLIKTETEAMLVVKIFICTIFASTIVSQLLKFKSLVLIWQNLSLKATSGMFVKQQTAEQEQQKYIV